MSLITEDGTGLANAESYISVTNADTYHSNRGNTTWATLTTTEKEQALRRSTDYMLQAYGGRWQGYRVNSTQALDWPRSWVTVDGYAVEATIVPTPVANACAELAWKAAAGELLADESQRVVREKIGPIETQYAEYGTQTKLYPSITSLLAPYFQIQPGTMRVIRA